LAAVLTEKVLTISDALENRRDPLSSANAPCRQAELRVAVFHRVNQRRGDARPTGAERMTDGESVV